MNLTESSRRPFMLTGAVALGTIALAFGGATAANAHVGAKPDTNEAGSYAVVAVSVPHGCDVSPTTKVALKIPEGINAVTPTRNAFYTVEKVMEKLDTPIKDSHGNDVTERVAEVVYTATTPLPADQRDVFELSLQIPEDAAGEMLFFPTIQTCEVGETAWVQMPADGQDPHELELPAPSFEVVPATGEGHGSHASESAEAHGTNESAASAQSPLVITSLLVGAAGLVAGVIALIRGRKQA